MAVSLTLKSAKGWKAEPIPIPLHEGNTAGKWTMLFRDSAKTKATANVVRDSVKSDKLNWITKKQTDKNILKHLEKYKIYLSLLKLITLVYFLFYNKTD